MGLCEEICDECGRCPDWNGNVRHCMDVCAKPADALQELVEYRKIGSVHELRRLKETSEKIKADGAGRENEHGY